MRRSGDRSGDATDTFFPSQDLIIVKIQDLLISQ